MEHVDAHNLPEQAYKNGYRVPIDCDIAKKFFIIHVDQGHTPCSSKK